MDACSTTLFTLYTLPRSTPSLVGSIEVPLSMLMGGGNDDGEMPVIPERKIPIGDGDDDNEVEDARNFNLVVEGDEDKDDDGGGETANDSDDGRRVAGIRNADTVVTAASNNEASSKNEESSSRRSILINKTLSMCLGIGMTLEYTPVPERKFGGIFIFRALTILHVTLPWTPTPPRRGNFLANNNRYDRLRNSNDPTLI